MFGKKATAEAQVVVAELLKRTHVEPVWQERWRWVLDVRPADAPPFRAAAEDNVKRPTYLVPKAGEPVLVEYDPRHPETVDLKLKGDARYDSIHGNKDAKQERSDIRAGRDAAFEAALRAGPGTPNSVVGADTGSTSLRDRPLKPDEVVRLRETILASLRAQLADGRLTDQEYANKLAEVEANPNLQLPPVG